MYAFEAEEKAVTILIRCIHRTPSICWREQERKKNDNNNGSSNSKKKFNHDVNMPSFVVSIIYNPVSKHSLYFCYLTYLLVIILISHFVCSNLHGNFNFIPISEAYTMHHKQISTQENIHVENRSINGNICHKSTYMNTRNCNNRKWESLQANSEWGKVKARALTSNL